MANREPLGQAAGRFWTTCSVSTTSGPASQRLWQVIAGHLPAARLVQTGPVDWCIGTQAVARTLALDFIPLAQKPYHLVLRRTPDEITSIQLLLQTLGLASFRRKWRRGQAAACGMPANVLLEGRAARVRILDRLNPRSSQSR